jgi:hypothetical protein
MLLTTICGFVRGPGLKMFLVLHWGKLAGASSDSCFHVARPPITRVFSTIS